MSELTVGALLDKIAGLPRDTKIVSAWDDPANVPDECPSITLTGFAVLDGWLLVLIEPCINDDDDDVEFDEEDCGL